MVDSKQTTTRFRGFAASFAAAARPGDPDETPKRSARIIAVVAVLGVTAAAAIGVGALVSRSGKATTAAKSAPSSGASGSPAAASPSPGTAPGRVVGVPAPGKVVGGPAPAPRISTVGVVIGSSPVKSGSPTPVKSGSLTPRRVTGPNRAAATAGSSGALISYYSNRCVDVTGSRAVNNAPLQAWDCTGAAWQRWTLYSDSTIRTLNMCMEAASAAAGNGTAVRLSTCDGSKTQQFGLNAAHDIVSLVAYHCVDLKDEGRGNGTRLQLWTCEGKSNQKWHM